MQKEEIPPKLPLISQKKCMYTKDHYTDEDRKVLCEDCEEKCEYSKKEEPVSILHNASKKYPLTGKEIIVLRDDKIYYGKYIGGFYRYVRAEIQLTCDMAQTYAIIDYLTKEDKWIYVEDLLNLSNVERTVNNWKEEPVSEDLGEYINELSKQFPEVSFAKLSRIAVRVAKWQKEQFEKNYTDLCKGIATAKGIAVKMAYDKGMDDAKEQMMAHLWKHADGDDLPEIDMEVIALIEAFGHYKVIFAHRVDENAEIHTSIDGKPLVLHPKRYDKGGWNIPNVKWWLDCSMPKEIEL